MTEKMCNSLNSNYSEVYEKLHVKLSSLLLVLDLIMMTALNYHHNHPETTLEGNTSYIVCNQYVRSGLVYLRRISNPPPVRQNAELAVVSFFAQSRQSHVRQGIDRSAHWYPSAAGSAHNQSSTPEKYD